LAAAASASLRRTGGVGGFLAAVSSQSSRFIGSSSSSISCSSSPSSNSSPSSSSPSSSAAAISSRLGLAEMSVIGAMTEAAMPPESVASSWEQSPSSVLPPRWRCRCCSWPPWPPRPPALPLFAAATTAAAAARPAPNRSAASSFCLAAQEGAVVSEVEAPAPAFLLSGGEGASASASEAAMAALPPPARFAAGCSVNGDWDGDSSSAQRPARPGRGRRRHVVPPRPRHRVRDPPEVGQLEQLRGRRAPPRVGVQAAPQQLQQGRREARARGLEGHGPGLDRCVLRREL
jgi:hypothetical protein